MGNLRLVYAPSKDLGYMLSTEDFTVQVGLWEDEMDIEERKSKFDEKML
ncbi:hypothetical protein MHZ95_08270 [Sporosarcina sp. ACRSM]|nr:hypothetical protein [Sporosarcina sp. ACRSM]MCG7335269.1 hypothetical protein [Sporosarcina sp. ACRSM]